MLIIPLPKSVCFTAFTGFTMPSPEEPSPFPRVHPIFWSILLPNPVVCFSQFPNFASIASALFVVLTGFLVAATALNKNCRANNYTQQNITSASPTGVYQGAPVLHA